MTAEVTAAAPGTAPLLSVRGVHKHFGGVTALDGVSLDVPAGMVYGLIGPNGSGKTTLFNIITGFLRADKGHVAFDGHSLDRLRPHQVARLGLCRTFQSSQSPEQMTVMENMLLAPQDQIGESLANMSCGPARSAGRRRRISPAPANCSRSSTCRPRPTNMPATSPADRRSCWRWHRC